MANYEIEINEVNSVEKRKCKKCGREFTLSEIKQGDVWNLKWQPNKQEETYVEFCPQCGEQLKRLIKAWWEEKPDVSTWKPMPIKNE